MLPKAIICCLWYYLPMYAQLLSNIEIDFSLVVYSMFAKAKRIV